MTNNNLLPLSHPQLRIWYSEKLYPGTSMWNNAGTVKIKGRLNEKLLEKAVLKFIENNDNVRLRITQSNGVPSQYVSEFSDTRIDILDFSNATPKQFSSWDTNQTNAPMSIENSCLYYFAIVKLPSGKGALYFKLHHIMSDGISLVAITNEIILNYRDLIIGKECSPTQNKPYSEYVEFERNYLSSKRFTYDKTYWNTRFSQLPAPTALKEKKSSYRDTKARRKSFVLSSNISSRIRDYCNVNNTSVFSFMLSAISTYIYKTTGQRDMVICAPVSNRLSKSMKNMLGMMVSIAPIRIELDDSLSFRNFIQNVSNEWFSVLKHQKYPYDILMQDLRKTHKNLDSLQDITFSYQNGTFSDTTNAFIDEGIWHFSNHQVNSLSIHMNDREGNGRFILDYDHLVPLFSLKDIEYIHEHLMCVVEDVLSYPEKSIAQISIVTNEERHLLLNEFNDTNTIFPSGQTLNDLWTMQVQKTPDNIAVATLNTSITYAELDKQASALAAHLQKIGLKNGDIVGIMVNRSLDLFVSIIGVIKAGCAFLPIHSELPIDRVTYMLKDCKAKTFILGADLADQRYLDYDNNIITTDKLKTLKQQRFNNSCRENDLAYIIYTSGSTGAPKGVAIEQHSIVHFIHSLCSIMDFSPSNAVLCAASISFDLFIMESLPTLTSGATLVLASEDEAAIPHKLVQLLAKRQVNKLMFTPSRMQLFMSNDQGCKYLANVREIMLGGDVLLPSLVQDLRKYTRSKIFNFYGPTEVTIAATYMDVTESKTVSIGNPMPNTKIMILDNNLNLVPIGVSGEIYISGNGLARGYINRPSLNALSFVDNPHIPGEKMYHTGDLAFWEPSGTIQYLGRADHQVKIRGYRIELGEIESRLKNISSIRDCAVVDLVDDSGRKYLCAYLCGQDLPSRSEITAELSRDLPSYMLPSHFVLLDKLPLNLSGKLDRKQLPDPLKHAITTIDNDFIPPKTPTEKALAGIWRNLLKIGIISNDDSFFDIGGDSLSVIAAVDEVSRRFNVVMSLEDVYRAPTLKGFARHIDYAQKINYAPINRIPKRKNYPASPAQQRMYILSSNPQSAIAYNIPIAIRISGKLNVNALEHALKTLISRHDSLRTSFVINSSKLRQQIDNIVDFQLQYYECSPTGLRSFLKKLNQPFDLSKAPLFSASLIYTGEDKHVLFINAHHSICDGRSLAIILSELELLYSKKMPLLPSLDYKDYTKWHTDLIESEHGEKQAKYWNTNLSDNRPLLNLPIDKPRSSSQTFTGSRISFNIDHETSQKLRMFASEQKMTLFNILLCAYYIFLQKYSGQEDIIVGVPISGRSRDELQNMVGMFVNTLPIRCSVSPDTILTTLLKSISETCFAAYSNADYPLDMIIRNLHMKPSKSRNPLFDTMMVFQPQDSITLSLPGLSTELISFNPGISKLDLTLEVYEQKNGLHCQMEYNSSLFKRSTVERMTKHFKNLLTSLTSSLNLPIKDISILSDAEIKERISPYNPTGFDTSVEIQSLFETMVNQNKEKTALIVDNKKLSFDQLNARSNAIAHRLLACGIKQNDIVAICLKRSSNLVASILGVLKSGAGYLPLDPTYPKDRISFILSDSDAKVLLCEDNNQREFNGQTISINDIGDLNTGNPNISTNCNDISYVIYTSGSTGQPKGVSLTRQAMLNLYHSTKDVIDYPMHEVCLSITTVAFDIFIADTILPLLYGRTVLLSTDEELRQTHLLCPTMEKYNADFIQATPTRMQLMLTCPDFCKVLSNIKTVVLGGEPVPMSLIKSIKKHSTAKIINGYGPSEATVYTTFKDLTNSKKVSIGKPVNNTRFYVLDKNKNLQPIGVTGEGYVSGVCVGLGYINRPELTSEKFVNDLFSPGEVMYATGDVCLLNDEGDFEMLGRIDNQVKIHGLRIELGEIEASIRSLPNITEAVVKDFGEGTEKYLCAYYTANRNIETNDFRSHLKSMLPSYMVPSFFKKLDKLPLTPNGKVDRKNLLEPIRQKETKKVSKAKETLTDTERIMKRIWSKILKVKSIGVNDSFFDLGGTSLDIIRVQTALLPYDIYIRTQDFFDYETLREICKRLNHAITNTKPVSINLSELHNKPIPLSSVAMEAADLSCVLLTGVTGFLGAHILHELIDKHDSFVYCLMRDTKHIACQQKLTDNLNYYFGPNITKTILNRVKIIQGDISLENLGIKRSDQKELMTNVKTIIHSAALTSHIGRSEIFKQINVQGTHNVIEFCKNTSASMVHISTISVSGSHLANSSRTDTTFSERNYYIGQNFENNEYVKSKFLAEGLVLKAIKEGLTARIFRVGNLTSRIYDSKYQINPNANAFANRIKGLMTVQSVPFSSLNLTVEMTPVDICAKAILTLCSTSGLYSYVYHVYNPNSVKITNIIDALRAENIPMHTVTDKTYISTIKELSKKGLYDNISLLVPDSSQGSSRSTIQPVSRETNDQLNRLGFSWPHADLSYIRLFINTLQSGY